jgi:diketogulonate reductase-like aldo/keto reductase
VELHPYLRQDDLLQFAKEHGIHGKWAQQIEESSACNSPLLCSYGIFSFGKHQLTYLEGRKSGRWLGRDGEGLD